MIEVDLTDIAINENAYFYKAIKPLSKTAIERIFNESKDDKRARRVYKSQIRVPLLNGPKEVGKYSLDIFEYKKRPSFFKESSTDWETKYGFFLILEYKGYLGIIKRNVSGDKTLDRYTENIDYTTLAHFLVTDKSKIEKIVSSSMNTAENAIQRKTSEAADLKGVTSAFGASKQILNTIRLDNDGIKSTIALNTSRVNSFKLKNDFDKVLFWMVEIFKLIDKAELAPSTSPFLNSFAAQVKFSDIIGDLEPTYVLLRLGALKDEIEANNISRCFRFKNGKEEDVDLLKEISGVERLIQLTKINDSLYENGANAVHVNKHSITFSNDDFMDIYLEYGSDDTINLNAYINGGSHFIVNFDKIEYVYTHRKIFRDSRLLGDLETFLHAFKTFPQLSSVKGEKVEKGKTYTPLSKDFNSNTLFYFIENVLAKSSDCIICDDMGVEWGDYISITQDEIAFYHAKYDKSGLSATKLEVVFGQAQKNFGSLELTDDMISGRASRWNSSYKIDSINTNIQRIRKCSNPKDALNSVRSIRNKASANPNSKRRVYIVINFLSKSKLAMALDQLKKSGDFANKGVTLQILWFVNSLLTSASERGAELYIVCDQ